MPIDWNIVATIAAPIVGVFAGVWINRKFEDRAKLVAFYGHVAAFKVRPAEGSAFDVYTHSVVIRNAGRRPATDVRISHGVFPPNVTVFPPVDYKTVALPEGSTELVFPTLVPGEHITISYLYFPPVVFNQVNTRVRSSEGFAKVVEALPTVVTPPWLRRTRTALVIIGITTALYVAWDIAVRIAKAAG